MLKGIPLSIVDDTVGSIDLSSVVSNKLGYFMAIFGHRHFLTYEEFLLLADFIVTQYKEIYILNNNIYMEQFPVEECFPDAIRAGLLTHFDESEEGETDSRYIGDIDEYISIFAGLKEYNGYLMGAYCSVPALHSPKVITVNVFESSCEDLMYSANQSDDFIEIIEESDYINFVKLLFAEPDEIYVRMSPALCVTVTYSDDYSSAFRSIWSSLKGFIGQKVISGEHTAVSEIVDEISSSCGLSKYKSQAICEVVIASMDSYRKNFARTATPIVLERTTNNGKTKYQFNVAVNSYFQWVESGLRKIETETNGGRLYIVNDNGNSKLAKEYSVILGILESMGILTFEMIGGANSQLYIYINQIQALKNILNAPHNYHNRLLEAVAERHLISVKMLTYLYEGDFTNEDRWDLLENYFLGVIPEKVKHDCKQERPDIIFD